MHTKSIHFETRRAAAADRIATVDRGLANSPSDRPTLAPPSYLNFMAAAAGGGEGARLFIHAGVAARAARFR
jgi:hypothetical protein